jgi:hypothetical protein
VVAGGAAGRREVAPRLLPRRLTRYSAGAALLFVLLHLGRHLVDPSRGSGTWIAALTIGYLAFGCLNGPRDALLQLGVVREAPAARRGSAFSWLAACHLFGFGLGSAASGATAQRLDAPFLVAGLAAVVAVALALLLARLSAGSGPGA